MKLSLPTRALIAVAALVSPSALFAQAIGLGSAAPSGQPAADTASGDAAANAASAAVSSTADLRPGQNATAQASLTQAPAEAPVFVPALNGAGVIAIDPLNKPLLTYGYQGDVGVDSSNVDGTAGLITASPYVAIQSRLGRTAFIAQYNPTFTKYTSGSYGGGNLQRASTRFLGSLTPRWRWNAGGTFAYGQDALRLDAPTESVAVGDISAVGPDAAVYRSNAGVGTFLNAGAGFTYLKSQRDSVDIQIGDSYSHFSGITGDSSTLSGRVNYLRKLSSTLTASPYGQILASTGSVACTSVGGGLGVDWQLAERTGLSLAAGPQFSSKQCGTQLTYLFNAAFNTRLNGVSQLYLLGGRQFSAPYLGPGLWQNTVGAGYQRMLSRTLAGTLDVSYAGSAGVGAGSDYRGTFVGGSLSRTLGRALNPSVTYRRIMSRNGSDRENRNTLVLSLSWTSTPIPVLD